MEVEGGFLVEVRVQVISQGFIPGRREKSRCPCYSATGRPLPLTAAVETAGEWATKPLRQLPDRPGGLLSCA